MTIRVLLIFPALAAMPARASEFLLAETSARAVASSGAYTAASGRLDCLSYNPGGLAGLPRLCGAFSHDQSFDDVSHDWLACGMPVGPGVLAAEYLSWQVQPFPRYDAGGRQAGEVSVQSRLAGLAGAMSLFNSTLDLGVRSRFFFNDLAGYTNNGWALDLGCVARLPDLPVSAGVCVQNLGEQTAYISESDPLPLLARMGFSWHPQFNEAFGVDVRADWVKFARPDGTQEFRLGAEASLYSHFSISTGTRLDASRASLSLGASFDAGMFEVAYAFVPDQELGATHEVSLAVFDLPALLDK